MTSVDLTRTAEVAGSPADVWVALAAFDRISAWADNVDHSALLTDGPPGVGTARRVQVGRMALVETITTWIPEVELAYTISGLPPVVGSVENRWNLRSADRGTLVSLTTSIDPGISPTGRLGSRVLALALRRASDQLLSGMGRRPWTWIGPDAVDPDGREAPA
jgi:hypothetical protein